MKVNFDIEDYCEHCPEFKPVVEGVRDFSDNSMIYEIKITCENGTKCRRIKRYLESHKEDDLK